MALLTTYEHQYHPLGMPPLKPLLVFCNHAEFTLKIVRGQVVMESESKETGNVIAIHEMTKEEAKLLAESLLVTLELKETK